jgi:transposase
VLERIDRRLRTTAGPRARIARELVADCRRLTGDATRLEHELTELIAAQRPRLLAGTGCGPLVAATLIGRTAGAQRFKTEASPSGHPYSVIGE